MSSSVKDGEDEATGTPSGAHPADGEGDGAFRTVAMEAPAFGNAPSPISDPPPGPRPGLPRPGVGPASRGRASLPLPSASASAPVRQVVKLDDDPADVEAGARTELLETSASRPELPAAAPAPAAVPKRPKPGPPMKLPPEALRSTMKSPGTADKGSGSGSFGASSASSSGSIKLPSSRSPLAATAVPMPKPKTEPYAFPVAKGSSPSSSSGSIKVIPNAKKDPNLPRLYDDDPVLDDGPTQLAAGLADAALARQKAPSRSDAETIAVDRSQIGVAQTEAPPAPKPAFATGRAAGEEEDTKAVAREDLVRAEPGLFGTVSDPPPFGEDSTLAVPAGLNPNKPPNLHAYASTVQATEGAPMGSPMQQSTAAFGAPPMPMPSMHGAPPMGSVPHVPLAAPPPHWAQQASMHPSVPQPSHVPMHAPQPSFHALHGNQGMPGMMGPGQGPMLHAPPPAPGAPVSRQMILLAAIGAVCLAIFGIGIYLFVTTKF